MFKAMSHQPVVSSGKRSNGSGRAGQDRPPLAVEALEDRICQSVAPVVQATVADDLVRDAAPAPAQFDCCLKPEGIDGDVSASAYNLKQMGIAVHGIADHDTIGGWGSDWISGGTGQDAVEPSSSSSSDWKYLPIRRAAVL